MNNLPINISNAAPVQAPAKQADSGAANRQDDQSFNNVLARQVNESGKQSSSSRSSKDKDKPAEKQDEAEGVPAAEIPPAVVSADMMASLLQIQTTPHADAYPQFAANTPDDTAAGKIIADLRGKPGGVHAASNIDSGDKAISELLTGAVPAKPDTAITGQNFIADNAKAGAIREAGNDINLVAQRGNLNGELPPSMQQSAALLPATATTSSNPAAISTPLAHPAWGDEFGQKITWMATQRNQSAELHLNPPQLGPLDVTLKMNGDQATAMFSSPHAAVREAIEQALPRLREMLADNGIMLNNAMVSDQSAKNSPDNAPRKSQGKSHLDSADNTAEINAVAETRVSTMRRHNGMVDTFA